MKLSILVIVLLAAIVQAFAQTKSPSDGPIEVAITMDDLPMTEPRTGKFTSLQIIHKIIESYKDAEVPVYGFMNGIWVTPEGTDEPETTHLTHAMKDWLKTGFPLSNHTFSHPDFASLSLRAEEAEILKNEKQLAKVGVDLSKQKWFRYPFLDEGETKEKRCGLRKYLAGKGYKIAQVTIDWSDSDWKDPYTRCVQKNNLTEVENLKKAYFASAREAVLNADADAKKLFGRPVKQILLMHVGEWSSQVLPDLLKELKSLGVKFISLEEAESDPIYQQDPGIISGNGMGFLEQVAQARGTKTSSIPSMPTAKYMDTVCK